MGSSTTSLGKGRAILAWLVLYVVGLFAQGAHVAFERHDVCEHGEFAHVDSENALHGESGAEAHEHGDVARAATSPGEDEHHHCGIAVASPVLAADFPVPAGFELFEAPQRERAPLQFPRVDPIARLRLAPHHSPPRS
ncbi:MAG: hypothetical protein HUU28_15620 [Planctomycetaceae bacterium]|nr:hypothetical protein [Planctomycetaceae bacterium]